MYSKGHHFTGTVRRKVQPSERLSFSESSPTVSTFGNCGLHRPVQFDRDVGAGA